MTIRRGDDFLWVVLGTIFVVMSWGIGIIIAIGFDSETPTPTSTPSPCYTLSVDEILETLSQPLSERAKEIRDMSPEEYREFAASLPKTEEKE